MSEIRKIAAILVAPAPLYHRISADFKFPRGTERRSQYH
jgi:hypothetical protein